jgi:excisionase family DNA binding protein
MSRVAEGAERGMANMPRLLSILRARRELGISRTTIYELIRDKKLRSVKIGRRRFVPAAAIDDFIAGLSD